MKIIADENIPCVEQAFASLGEVTLLPGRACRPAQVRDADILLVRSVTSVDQALLQDSAGAFCRFGNHRFRPCRPCLAAGAGDRLFHGAG